MNVSADASTEPAFGCPVCGKRIRTEEQHGIRVELCDDHGMWLDPGELETVVLRLTSRYLRKGRRRADSARRRGKTAGAMFGWWSLLMDP